MAVSSSGPRPSRGRQGREDRRGIHRRHQTIRQGPEVWRILECVRIPVYKACLTTIYACGLRLMEGATLSVPQIDSERMVLLINGKGRKDRLVPLPQGVLLMLRKFWMTHRCPTWIFPAPSRKGLKYSLANDLLPVNRSRLQGAFRRAKDKAGIHKKAHIHTLCHSYATHLLEDMLFSVGGLDLDKDAWLKPSKQDLC